MNGGLPKDYYTKKLTKLNMSKSGNGYKITLDFQPQGQALDRAQDALDAAVADSVYKRMPVDTGMLRSETMSINAQTRGRVYLYPPNSEYGHYQYEGILYVDPITQKGAFYNEEYGFWSRPGVAKVPSDRKLTYSQPNAVARWGEVAYEQDKDEWLKVVQRALG